jgi:hypothetical protein
LNTDSEDSSERDPSRPSSGRHRALGERLLQARVTHFGADALPELSRQLGVPERTWRNYEAGIVMPADVMLRFMVLTGLTACELLQDGSPVGEGHPDPGESVREQ